MGGGGQKLHNGELHQRNKVIKSRRMLWARHVACKGQLRNAYRILSENLKRRVCLGELGVGDRIILKSITKK